MRRLDAIGLIGYNFPMDSAYDVFISFKNSDEHGSQTKDSDIAKNLYNYLVKKGLSVFFSNTTLEERGKSEYTAAIDEALDTSQCLVVVSCKPEHINAKWIRYEWESFINDIRSGIKSGSEVFVLYDDMDITELPRALRLKQSFHASDANSFERIYNFIKNFLSDNNSNNGNVTSPAVKNDTFSAFDLVLKKLDEMPVFRETYYERERVSHHFRAINDSNSQVNVFAIDGMVNIIPIFYHEVASLLENTRTVLWFANLNEFDKYKNEFEKDLMTAEGTSLSLFVDYVYNLKEFEVLYAFTLERPNVTLYTASRNFDEIAECYPEIKYYEIKAMDDSELIDLIFVVNRRWTPDYKWRYIRCLKLQLVPGDFIRKLDYLLYGPWNLETWAQKREMLQNLVDETIELIMSDLPKDNWYDSIDH
jgi:hypothetical protein